MNIKELHKPSPYKKAFFIKAVWISFATIALGACSTLGSITGEKASRPDETAQLALEQTVAKNAELEKIVGELRAENQRLTQDISTLKRAKSRAEAVRATLEKEAEEAQDIEVAAQDPSNILTVPAPPKSPETIIVTQADAEPLSLAALPVEEKPRLVEPSFASVDAVFENEALGSSISTTSVLFGVHLASYQRAVQVSDGWRSLQSKNPDELGLLEPRVERITIEGRGDFYRLIAGGFSSEEKAKSLCAVLKQRQIYCAVSDFTGKRLDSPAGR